jgi:hypothetical protein
MAFVVILKKVGGTFGGLVSTDNFRYRVVKFTCMVISIDLDTRFVRT